MDLIAHTSMLFISKPFQVSAGLLFTGTVRRFLEKYPDTLDTLLFVCTDDNLVSIALVALNH